MVVKDKVGDAKYLIHFYELNQPYGSVEAVVERFHTEGSGELVVGGGQGRPPEHLHPGHRPVDQAAGLHNCNLAVLVEVNEGTCTGRKVPLRAQLKK